MWNFWQNIIRLSCEGKFCRQSTRFSIQLVVHVQWLKDICQQLCEGDSKPDYERGMETCPRWSQSNQSTILWMFWKGLVELQMVEVTLLVGTKEEDLPNTEVQFDEVEITREKRKGVILSFLNIIMEEKWYFQRFIPRSWGWLDGCYDSSETTRRKMIDWRENCL